MTRFLVSLFALVALAAPALAQTRALPPGEIRANGDITFGNALKLGKRDAGKTIITPDTLQILGSGSTGPVDGMNVTAPGTVTARSLAERAGDRRSARDFGAKGDGVNDTTALSNYFVGVSDGQAVRFTAGVYPTSATQTVSSKTFIATGEGSRLTRLRKIGNGDGLTVVLDDGKQSADLRGVTIDTTGYNSGTGYTAGYYKLGFDDRASTRAVWDDVEFTGANPRAQGWGTLAHLLNINGLTSSKLQLNGIAPQSTGSIDEAQHSITKTGVLWDGTVYPTDGLFSQTRAYSLGTVFKVAGAAEGMSWHQFTSVYVGTFLDWTPDSGFGGRPHLSLQNGHAAVYESVAKIGAVQNVWIKDILGYHIGTRDGVLLNLTDVADTVIDGNQLLKFATGTAKSTGLVLAGTNTRNVRVSKNHFGGTANPLDVCAYIAAGTPGVTIANDNYWNCATDIDDRTNGLVQYGGRRDVFQMAANAGQSLPNDVETVIKYDAPNGDNFLGMIRNADGSFTVPPGKGIRRITVTPMTFFGNSAVGSRAIRVTKNNGAVPWLHDIRSANGNDASTLSSMVIPVVPGDVIRVTARQNSGGALPLAGFGYTQVTITEN